MTDVQAPACIFCGGDTDFVRGAADNDRIVRCNDHEDCGAEGPIRQTEAEAVAAFLKPVDDARKELDKRVGHLCGYPMCACNDKRPNDPAFCQVLDEPVPDVTGRLEVAADARRKALEEARTLCKAIARAYDDEAHDKFKRPGEFVAAGKSSAAEECEEAIRALMPAPDPAAPEAVTEAGDGD